ncbi:MAG: serine hydrolase domain-containing protein [Vicinamibacteraceae bacterium]
MSSSSALDARVAVADTVVRAAVAAGTATCAVLEIGDTAGVRGRVAVGRLSAAADAASADGDTIFDLASLTKVLATTLLVMRLEAAARCTTADRVERWWPAWYGPGRDETTIADLLAHASGLAAHRCLYEGRRGALAFADAICRLPLDAPPRTAALYSDLGFILLGVLLERIGDAGLVAQVAPMLRALTDAPLAYRPPASWRPRIASTGWDACRQRELVGEVHDANAWAMDGVAAHAGLFGTAGAVGDVGRAVLRALRGGAVDGLAGADAVRRFATRRDDVAGTTRALGWDTMKPTSSCGRFMSPTAIGHTGFTGTSLWIDDARDAYVVLLTNRVAGGATGDAIRALRQGVHDAVFGPA